MRSKRSDRENNGITRGFFTRDSLLQGTAGWFLSTVIITAG
jgi:hypothetical protein